MNIDFLKSPSAAESAFRTTVCSVALAALILCAGSSLYKSIISKEHAEKLAGTAFMTYGTSVPDAYAYRDFYDEYIAGK